MQQQQQQQDQEEQPPISLKKTWSQVYKIVSQQQRPVQIQQAQTAYAKALTAVYEAKLLRRVYLRVLQDSVDSRFYRDQFAEDIASNIQNALTGKPLGVKKHDLRNRAYQHICALVQVPLLPAHMPRRYKAIFSLARAWRHSPRQTRPIVIQAIQSVLHEQSPQFQAACNDALVYAETAPWTRARKATMIDRFAHWDADERGELKELVLSKQLGAEDLKRLFVLIVGLWACRYLRDDDFQFENRDIVILQSMAPERKKRFIEYRDRQTHVYLEALKHLHEAREGIRWMPQGMRQGLLLIANRLLSAVRNDPNMMNGEALRNFAHAVTVFPLPGETSDMMLQRYEAMWSEFVGNTVVTNQAGTSSANPP